MIGEWLRRRKVKRDELAALEQKAAQALANIDAATEEQKTRNNGHHFEQLPVDAEIEEAAGEALGILEASLHHGNT